MDVDVLLLRKERFDEDDFFEQELRQYFVDQVTGGVFASKFSEKWHYRTDGLGGSMEERAESITGQLVRMSFLGG